MDINELIDEVKKKLGVDTDYKLCKELEISFQDMSKYRKGIKTPDEYACFKFAEILQRAPSEVIAMILAQKAKSEHKRLYFKNFFSIVALWITISIVLPNFTDIYGSAKADGLENKSMIYLHKAPLCAIKSTAQTVANKMAILLKNERYFTCNWHVKYQSTAERRLFYW